MAKEFKRNLPLRYAFVLLLLPLWYCYFCCYRPPLSNPPQSVFKKFYARHERNLLHSGVQSFYPFHIARPATCAEGIRGA